MRSSCSAAASAGLGPGAQDELRLDDLAELAAGGGDAALGDGQRLQLRADGNDDGAGGLRLGVSAAGAFFFLPLPFFGFFVPTRCSSRSRPGVSHSMATSNMGPRARHRRRPSGRPGTGCPTRP